nr:hypothetical protein HUO10_006403 [Paraburkholderia busanensis]
MSTGNLLHQMFRYQTWANTELLDSIEGLDAERHATERHIAVRLMNHCLVVGKIFAAHLSGAVHGFAADNTAETPTLNALRGELSAIDNWYLDYVSTVTPAQLSQAIEFSFTDGDDGTMTREEMLTHVVIHSGYHRGEVGRVLQQVAASSSPGLKLPWDTYAVHLHRTEPSRRLHSQNQTTETVRAFK